MNEFDKVSRIITNMEQVVIGKKDKIEMVVIALLAKGHILLGNPRQEMNLYLDLYKSDEIEKDRIIIEDKMIEAELSQKTY